MASTAAVQQRAFCEGGAGATVPAALAQEELLAEPELGLHRTPRLRIASYGIFAMYATFSNLAMVTASVDATYRSQTEETCCTTVEQSFQESSIITPK